VVNISPTLSPSSSPLRGPSNKAPALEAIASPVTSLPSSPKEPSKIAKNTTISPEPTKPLKVSVKKGSKLASKKKSSPLEPISPQTSLIAALRKRPSPTSKALVKSTSAKNSKVEDIDSISSGSDSPRASSRRASVDDSSPPAVRKSSRNLRSKR
jgi:hypothetical protein